MKTGHLGASMKPLCFFVSKQPFRGVRLNIQRHFQHNSTETKVIPLNLLRPHVLLRTPVTCPLVARPGIVSKKEQTKRINQVLWLYS